MIYFHSMLVRCIESGGSKSRDLITVGRLYELYNSNYSSVGYYMYGMSYYIINDRGIKDRYSSTLFISVQELRDNMLDEILK
jgi:hypothetical protein